MYFLVAITLCCGVFLNKIHVHGLFAVVITDLHIIWAGPCKDGRLCLSRDDKSDFQLSTTTFIFISHKSSDHV